MGALICLICCDLDAVKGNGVLAMLVERISMVIVWILCHVGRQKRISIKIFIESARLPHNGAEQGRVRVLATQNICTAGNLDALFVDNLAA